MIHRDIMLRLALLVLAGALLATPARAQTFQVDAERNGATIIRRPCDGGPCCNTCHVAQPAPDKKPPKHDRELYSKYLVQLAEGKRLRVSRDSYVTREKGELVLYEGKTRTVLPSSGLILKDDGERAAIVLTEGVTGTR
jgi:hypothetical protein